MKDFLLLWIKNIYFISSVGILFLKTAPLTAKTIVNQTIVTVNGDIILDSEVTQFMQKAKSPGFKELFAGMNPKALQDRKSVLQLLIEEKIIDQEVKKLELGAAPEEVDGQIRSITRRNNITQKQLEMRLSQLGTPMSEYKKALQRQIERKNLVDREIRPNMEISEEQLRHYFARSGQASDKERQFEFAHILVSQGGKTRAQSVYEQLSKDPSQFEALAKQFSDDQSTAEKGGKLGTFAASSLSLPFRQALSQLKTGEISKPISVDKTQIHILKLLSVKQGDLSTLPEERKQELRQQMIAEEMEKKFSQWMDKKKTDADIVWSKNYKL